MAQSTASSTQEHLPIAGIQDGTVIMTDGSLRVILRIEPINFDLKSEQEQNGIIYGYQSFLNSLDFPIQFIIQSKKLDLERYLIRLQESQKQVTNDLLRIQIEDYVGFVRQLISVANIMSKRFYAVISYAAATKQSGVSQITGLLHKQPTGPLMDQDQFNRYRAEANNRASIIASGLGRVGVKCSLLGTQDLIELFYGIYNPDVATEERLTGDVANLSSGVVTGPSGTLAQQTLNQPPEGQVVPPPGAVAVPDQSLLTEVPPEPSTPLSPPPAA